MKVGKDRPLGQWREQVGGSDCQPREWRASQVTAKPIRGQRAGRDCEHLKNQQRHWATAGGIQRHKRQQHWLEVECQKRVGPRQTAHVDLRIPGRTVIHTRAEPLPAQKVPQDLICEPEVFGVRAAGQVADNRQIAETHSPENRGAADDGER